MYAIFQTGGKQYKVSAGDVIKVEKIEALEGADVVLTDVLLVSDGEKLTVGRPHVKGAEVVAEVIEQGRGKKIIVFKKRSKKTYKKTIGHRQWLTELKIKEIKTA
ncbi:MAG: 50S ribosomal protein L21 [Endomicrobiales bacterium]|nr:50S ribosomal protein L21 [Endomicrobiales bacterium]